MGIAFSPEPSSVIRAELQPVYQRLNELILGKPEQIRLALTCLLANGHLLMDDLPGMGKTVLSHALAKVLGLDYKRVQFTNDLLPADLLGGAIYDRQAAEFRFVPGPVFCQLLLADEINRASPKTQSALLEVMEERQVSLDGATRVLPEPFFVIATQNPLEQIGTSALPESQQDRFMMRLQMGYPGRAAELAIFAGDNRRQMLSEQEPLLVPERLQAMQCQVAEVVVSETVLTYLYELVAHTRQCGEFINGLSTRGGLALLQAAKAYAWVSDRDHVLPGDVQTVFAPVAGHRLLRRDGASEHELHLLIKAVPVPR